MRTLLLPALLPFVAACGAKWSVDDADGDGISPAEGDCWDRPEGPEGSGLTGADLFPGAPDPWYDGFDQDCAGNDDFDADGDGWVPAPEHVGRTTFGVSGTPAHVGSGDCWDIDDDGEDRSPLNGLPALAAADVNPEAGDIWYDGIDANCAGDDDLDADADGFRAADYEGRDGQLGDDCADDDSAINPGVPFEACNDIDDDCDGLLDGDDDNVAPGDTRQWAIDADGDGFGAVGSVVSSCSALEGHIEGDGEDCDDASAAIFPGAEEVCNGADDDCDLLVDDGDPSVNASIGGVVVYDDADGDGYGNVDTARFSCELPGGASDNPLDCDDEDAAIQPDAQEVCDTVDNDCDGATDDEDDSTDLSTGITAYTDGDGDGFGTASSPVQACEAPLGTAPNDDDCDDAAATRFPGAPESTGDEVDQDCDGGELCFVDADDDGYRLTSTLSSADADCADAGEAPASAPSGDCDDARAAVNPAAAEACDADNRDEDCDGNADDADTGGASGKSTFYTDADGDAFGDAASPVLACDLPTGAVINDEDCDDSDAAILPTAAELSGDEVDQNCDGVEVCYVDADNDGYRPNASATVVSVDLSCTGSGEALASDPTGDCDDARPAISPAGTEVCDGANRDEDCDGDADDADTGGATGKDPFYSDIDGDGYGDPGTLTQRCDPLTGLVGIGTDCDDAASDVNPGEDEVCNDFADNDCDGGPGVRSGGGECAFADADLSTANLALRASVNNTGAGNALAFLGDITGDGRDDFAVGASLFDVAGAGGNDRGVVWLLSATHSSATVGAAAAPQELASAAQRSWVGVTGADQLGTAIAGGDLTGDGVPDLVFSAPRFQSQDRGAVYFVPGPITATGQVDVTTVTRRDGSNNDDLLGFALAFTSGLDGEGVDADGDGFSDLLIGAPQFDSSAAGNGEVRLLTSSSYASGTFGTTTATLTGTANGDRAGTAVAWVDADGDGISDILVGAPDANTGGEAYLLDAPSSGTVALSSGRRFVGTGGNEAGIAVAGLGDLDGDGYSDFAIGEHLDDTSGSDAGTLSLFRGGAAALTAGAVNLSSADLRLHGEAAGDRLGFAVSTAGDVDGDGQLDVIVGAWRNDTTGGDAGAAYLLPGPVFALGTLSDVGVVRWAGQAASDRAGIAVAGGGDVNNDGFGDLLIGATLNSSGGGSNRGAAYLLLGIGL